MKFREFLNEAKNTVYYIEHIRYHKFYEGTVGYFVFSEFSDELRRGRENDPKVNDHPTTIKGLINSLNRAENYYRGHKPGIGKFYRIATKEEFDNAKDKKNMNDLFKVFY